MGTKYKATEKNGFLKEGTEFGFTNCISGEVSHYDGSWKVNKEEKIEWINFGWCEEVQEPEFTKDQLRDKCVRFAAFTSRINYDELARVFNEWIKSKKNNGN